MKEGLKLDADKAPWQLLPMGPIADIVHVLKFGAVELAPGNWTQVPEPMERYYAAAMRHLAAWGQGESHDQESHLPHLAHALCCLVLLRWFERGRK